MADEGKTGVEQLRETLRELAIREICDESFTARASDSNSYADWLQIREPLLSCLSTTPPPRPPETSSSSTTTSPPTLPLAILIPGCCSSRLPEHLYDAGFHCIVNINFSKSAVSEMLSRNVRSRPVMKWRIMNMTKMQFEDEIFDIVLDNGGLDGLILVPELGLKLGNQYISEVKRVLQKGGKFMSHFGFISSFRYGWRVTIHALTQTPSNKPTFMVIAEKESSSMLHMISLPFDPTSLPEHQVHGLLQALETENKFREEFSNGSDILYTLEDLKLGAKGDLKEFRPGQRIHITLGEVGRSHSRFVYRAVLLDYPHPSDSEPFSYNIAVFLVQETRAHEWIFSTGEGQWMVIENARAARLIMVFLDSSHAKASMEEIQADLSPLVKQLEPWENSSGAQIRYFQYNDGIKKSKLVHQVTSSLIGPISVEDVVYEKDGDDFCNPSKDMVYRRLTVPRSQRLIQSQALVIGKEYSKVSGEKDRKKTHSSKSKKRGKQKRNEYHASQIEDSSNRPTVDLDHLANVYHAGIISGFVLISSYLERMASSGQSVKATIIGLGAGLLPMFLHRCLPFVHIEVVEFDPVLQDLARDFFSFKEDERLKVHIADGILFVKDAGKAKAPAEMTSSCENEDANPSISCESSLEPIEVEEGSNRVDILIIDVDSFDSSSGLTCPSVGFVEESFLLAVKDYINEQGLFIINLLTRSSTMKDLVISRMKTVFSNLYFILIEDDAQDIIFALNTNVPTVIDLSKGSQIMKKLLKLNHHVTGQLLMGAMTSIDLVE